MSGSEIGGASRGAGVEVFVYPPGLDERFRKTSRNRRLGCWPIFCGLPVVLGIWIALQGGTNAWVGWACAGAFPLGAMAFEYGFARHAKRTRQLSLGWLTFDGKSLRQHGPGGEVVAEIDTTRGFSTGTESVAGNYMLQVRQDKQRLEFTSAIDQGKRVAEEILKIRDPGDSSG